MSIHMIPNPISAEYAAGLFDGEGCVASAFRGKYTRVYARISMCDPRGLQALVDRFGGHLRKLDPRSPRHRTQWHWELYGEQVKTFFEAILPFVLVKRAEVEAALQFLSLVKPRGCPRKNIITKEEGQTRLTLLTEIRNLKVQEFKELPSWPR